jgi:DNA-binding XRE family transcriptional regulator
MLYITIIIIYLQKKSMDWYILSDTEVATALGGRLRLNRMEHSFTQQMLAEKSGLNRATIRDMEKGKSIQLLSLIAVLRSLDLLEKLESLLPGLEESPVLMHQFGQKKRIRLSKNS